MHGQTTLNFKFCNLLICMSIIERTGSNQFSATLYGEGGEGEDRGITQKTTLKYIQQLDIQGDQVFFCAFC